MSTFTYNQFKNPNNEGIYYTDHFHNINSGININHSHTHNDHNHFSYNNARFVNPHLHRKWVVKENVTDNNTPVFRKNTDGNSNVLMQPEIIETASKFRAVPKKQVSTDASSRLDNISASNLRIDTTGRVGLSQSALLTFDQNVAAVAAEEAGVGAVTGTASGLVDDFGTENLVLSGIGGGIYSYIDFDQGTSTDSAGAKHMNIMPLKEALEAAPVFHGTPLQKDSPNVTISGNNVKLTDLDSLTGKEHTHYFPIRGRIINGYTTTVDHESLSYNPNSGGVPSFPNNNSSKNYSSRPPVYPNNVNYNHNHSNTNIHNFRLF